MNQKKKQKNSSDRDLAVMYLSWKFIEAIRDLGAETGDVAFETESDEFMKQVFEKINDDITELKPQIDGRVESIIRDAMYQAGEDTDA